jgi:murein DD-endopeptidase MepM/ murein hydrolase activator NlpD
MIKITTAKRRMLIIGSILGLVVCCCLGMITGDIPNLRAIHSDNYDRIFCMGFGCHYVSKPTTYGILPPNGGSCSHLMNRVIPGNPISGWPVEPANEVSLNRVCRYTAITSVYCDPSRGKWGHYGIDLAWGMDWTHGEWVISTIDRAEVTWAQNGDEWNSGMGSNVRICWQRQEEVYVKMTAPYSDLTDEQKEFIEECYWHTYPDGTQVYLCDYWEIDWDWVTTDWCASYFHLIPGSIVVNEGDIIFRGEHLGQINSTGNSSGDHLHYQLSGPIYGKGGGLSHYDPAPTMCGEWKP